MAETTDADGWGETIRNEMDAGRQASAVEAAWDSEDALVAFLVAANKPSAKDGIGSATGNRIFDWFEREHPDADRERKENDEAVCTAFTTDHELPDYEIEAGTIYFAFVCPRCGRTNPLEGDPLGFGDRPFQCVRCQWVSLLDADALERFAETLQEERG